jgi:transposase
MRVHVGIDVSKATLDVVIRVADKPHHHQVANSRAGFQHLQGLLQPHQPLQRIGLEATGRYGEPLADFLVAQGYPVSYLNPKQLHAFGKVALHAHKTDKHDAQRIAHFCQLHTPALWHPPTPHQRQLQQRSRRLHTLEKVRQQERNRLQSGVTDPFVLDQLRSHIAYLDTLIVQTQRAIADLIQQSDGLQRQTRLLTSIKGIGDKTAAVLLAELGDIARFASPQQLAAYIGITPQHCQSGTSVRKRSAISKQGNARVRAALYMPAIVAKRWNPACRQLAARLAAAHKPGKVIIVAIMRKLVHQLFAILKSGRPFDPKRGLTP